MSYSLQVSNAIPITSWFDSPKDTELRDLLPILEMLNRSNDVRSSIRKLQLRSPINYSKVLDTLKELEPTPLALTSLNTRPQLIIDAWSCSSAHHHSSALPRRLEPSILSCDSPREEKVQSHHTVHLLKENPLLTPKKSAFSNYHRNCSTLKTKSKILQTEITKKSLPFSPKPIQINKCFAFAGTTPSDSNCVPTPGKIVRFGNYSMIHSPTQLEVSSLKY